MATTFVSQERVLVFFVGSAGYYKTPDGKTRRAHPAKIMQIAEANEGIVVAYACMNSKQSQRDYRHELDGCGFTKLSAPTEERGNPILEHIALLFKEARSVERIIFVANQRMVPVSFIGAMHSWKVPVTILTPEATAARSPFAESITPIHAAIADLASADDEPLIVAAPVPSNPGLNAPTDVSQGIFERLVNTDPHGAALTYDVLAVNNTTLGDCRERLNGGLASGTLNPVLTAALIILATVTVRESDGAPIIPKKEVWRELIRHGIDIEDAGLLAIELLHEEHLVHRLEDGKLLLTRSHPDPLLSLARTFQATLRQSGNTDPSASTVASYTERVLAALTLWKKDPALLDENEHQDLLDWVRLILLGQPEKNRARQWRYGRRQVSPADAAALEQRAAEILDRFTEEPDGPTEDTPSQSGLRTIPAIRPPASGTPPNSNPGFKAVG